MDEIKDDMLEVNGENLLPEEEQLLGQFFAEHQLDVEDRGFTNRVMRRLPDRSVCLNRIWTAICSVAVVVLFFLTKGWVSIFGTMQGIFTNTVTSVSQTGTMVLLTVFAGYGLVMSER